MIDTSFFLEEVSPLRVASFHHDHSSLLGSAEIWSNDNMNVDIFSDEDDLLRVNTNCGDQLQCIRPLPAATNLSALTIAYTDEEALSEPTLIDPADILIDVSHHAPEPSLVEEAKHPSLDGCKKQMMRAFRTHVKQQFNDVYLHKQYHWVNSTKKKAVREFFIDEYGVPEEIYSENEAFFLKLIFNTLQNDKISSNFTVDTTTPLSSLLDQVMKAKPNNKNLKKFFAHKAVQLVWGAHQGKQTPFRETGLPDMLRKMSLVDRQWFCSKLQKVDWKILG